MWEGFGGFGGGVVVSSKNIPVVLLKCFLNNSLAILQPASHGEENLSFIFSLHFKENMHEKDTALEMGPIVMSRRELIHFYCKNLLLSCFQDVGKTELLSAKKTKA